MIVHWIIDAAVVFLLTVIVALFLGAAVLTVAIASAVRPLPFSTWIAVRSSWAFVYDVSRVIARSTDFTASGRSPMTCMTTARVRCACGLFRSICTARSAASRALALAVLSPRCTSTA